MVAVLLFCLVYSYDYVKYKSGSVFYCSLWSSILAHRVGEGAILHSLAKGKPIQWRRPAKI
jgi:hypothetical protein